MAATRRLLRILLLAAGCVHAAGGVAADSPRPPVEWIIPFASGGGSDTWARFTAPFLAAALPESPGITVVNLPGGGSIRGVNRYALEAPSDGTLLLGTSASTQFAHLLGDPRVRFDYDAWEILMISPTGGVVYLSPDLGISGLDELFAGEEPRLMYGSQGPTSVDLVPLLAFDLLGLDVRTIFGMRGRDAGRLAFERGEATIDFQTSAAYLANVATMVNAGRAIPLFSLGALDESGRLVRDPVFPGLPHFGEVYESVHGQQPGGVAWESWFAFFSAGFGAQKFLVIPSETEPEVLAMYREAARTVIRSPNYIEQKDAVLGPYDQLVGSAARRMYRLATTIPEESRQWIRSWLRGKYDLRI